MSKYRIAVDDYTTVVGATPLDLEQQVREMLHDDWQPLGGGFYAVEEGMDIHHVHKHHGVWCQTMVRRVKDKLLKTKEDPEATKAKEVEKAWTAMKKINPTD